MLSILTGLLSGAVHVWAGPDHLAALAPLAVRQPRGAWLAGARWGLGHGAGVLLVGLGSLVLRERLPLDWLASWSERLVGVLLIGIGLWALRRALQLNVHAHEHRHDGEEHVHLHLHTHVHAAPHAPGAAHRHTHAALGIGMLHGLAGSSHLLGVLPSLAMPSQSEAVLYLLAFGIGTVLSMASFSWILASITRHSTFGSVKAYRGLLGSSALGAMGVGVFWLATSWG